jgi:hypothetical protein
MPYGRGSRRRHGGAGLLAVRPGGPMIQIKPYMFFVYGFVRFVRTYRTERYRFFLTAASGLTAALI